MVRNTKKYITILIFIVVLVVPIKLQASKTNAYPEDECILIEMDENEAAAIINESEHNIIYYSAEPACRLAIKKDKGMVKVAYSIKQAEVAAKIGLNPVKLQKKNQGKWQDISGKSPYKQNSRYYTGGFIYRNPSLGNIYRSIGNFYTTNKGKTNKYYRATNVLNF